MATRTDKGIRHFMAAVGQVAGAGTGFCAVALKNPAESGYKVTLKRMIFDNAEVTAGTEEDYYIAFGRKDDDITDGIYASATTAHKYTQDSAGDSAAQIGNYDVDLTTDAATDLPTVTFMKLALPLNANPEVRFDIPGVPKSGLVLTEGTAFVVKGLGNDKQDLDVTFDWIEEAIL